MVRRTNFECHTFRTPTTVWNDMVAYQSFEAKQAFSEGEEKLGEGFAMYRGADGTLSIQHVHWGADSPESWFQLLQLIREHQNVNTPVKQPTFFDGFVYGKDSIPSEDYFQLRISQTVYPRQELVCYPISESQWRCHYTLTETVVDSTQGIAHKQYKDPKTGERRYVMILKDTTVLMDAHTVLTFQETMWSSTLKHPHFNPSRPVLDGVSYLFVSNRQGQEKQKFFGNLPIFLRETIAIEDFSSLVPIH